MVRSHDENPAPDRTDARAARRTCRLLLDRLEQNRRASDERRVERGGIDPLRVITGSSALDGAVASTRAMLRDLDTLIDELEGLAAAGPPVDCGRTILLNGRAEAGVSAVQSAATQ